jgi:hypothetical protein
VHSQIVVGEPELRHHARPETFNYDVSATSKIKGYRASRLRFKIQLDASLVAIERQIDQAMSIMPRWTQHSSHIAGWALYFYDIGTKITQEHSAGGSGPNLRKIKNPNVVQTVAHQDTTFITVRITRCNRRSVN